MERSSSGLTRGFTIHLSLEGGRLVIVYLSFPRRLVFEIRLHGSYVHPLLSVWVWRRRVWSGAYQPCEKLLSSTLKVILTIPEVNTSQTPWVDVLTRLLNGACAIQSLLRTVPRWKRNFRRFQGRLTSTTLCSNHSKSGQTPLGRIFNSLAPNGWKGINCNGLWLYAFSIRETYLQKHSLTFFFAFTSNSLNYFSLLFCFISIKVCFDFKLTCFFKLKVELFFDRSARNSLFK